MQIVWTIWLIGVHIKYLLGLLVKTLLSLLKRGRVDGESKTGNNLSRSYKHLPAAHWKMHPTGKKLSLPLVAQPKYSKMNWVRALNWPARHHKHARLPSFSSHFLLLKLQFWLQKLHICHEVGKSSSLICKQQIQSAWLRQRMSLHWLGSTALGPNADIPWTAP